MRRAIHHLPTVPGVATKIVHRETGEPLKQGEEGLILVKGPNRMLGYLNLPTETQAVLRDGWYVTGDIAIIDGDGFVRLIDRQSSFSKLAGEMVPHGKLKRFCNRSSRVLPAPLPL
jgi:acyl-[acyl-carrier-protein]-phospholipid O-acyltransferase/long-chain-fatty-acid--[acyl-carrier-protein] ligase